jgi:hypothetical protein
VNFEPHFNFQGYVFFYVCVCRSLANGFGEWNKKAEDIFAYKGPNRPYSIDQAYPCSLDHLVTSHFMLLKLVNDANDILGIIVGPYFATQVYSLRLFQMKLPPNIHLFVVTADLRCDRIGGHTILKLADHALFKMVRYVLIL